MTASASAGKGLAPAKRRPHVALAQAAAAPCSRVSPHVECVRWAIDAPRAEPGSGGDLVSLMCQGNLRSQETRPPGLPDDATRAVTAPASADLRSTSAELSAVGGGPRREPSLLAVPEALAREPSQTDPGDAGVSMARAWLQNPGPLSWLPLSGKKLSFGSI